MYAPYRRRRGRLGTVWLLETTFAMEPLMTCLSTAPGLIVARRRRATCWSSSETGSEGGRTMPGSCSSRRRDGFCFVVFFRKFFAPRIDPP